MPFSGGQIGEIFQAGEPVRPVLDGVPGLVQELAMSRMRLLTVRPDAGQGGDAGLAGQGAGAR
jgi:hypothetical protein